MPREQVETPPRRLAEERQRRHPGVQQVPEVVAGDQDAVDAGAGPGRAGEPLLVGPEGLGGGTRAQKLPLALAESVKAANWY